MININDLKGLLPNEPQTTRFALWILWGYSKDGSQETYVIPKEWQEMLAVQKNALFKALRRLCSLGYIKRAGHTLGGYAKYMVSLTAKFLTPEPVDNLPGDDKVGIPQDTHAVSHRIPTINIDLNIQKSTHRAPQTVDNLDATDSKQCRAVELQPAQAQNQNISPSDRKTLARSNSMKKPLTSFSGPKTIPDDWRAYCLQTKPTLNPELTYEAFADHWTTLGDKKRDWGLTWRNWVRREHAPKATPLFTSNFSQTNYTESTAI